jgi:hypothetical protein
LRCDCPRPLVVLLAHRGIDIVPSWESVFQPISITFSKRRIPDGTEFSRFKQVVFQYLAQFPKSYIGVCSSKGKNLPGYFIVRWLIEEKCIAIAEAISLFNMSVPHGLTKSKYLDSITEIYSDEFVPPPEPFGSPTVSHSTFPRPSFSPTVRHASPERSGPTLLRVEAVEANLTVVSSGRVQWVDDTDTIIETIGRSVQPKTADKIRTELRVLLDLQPADPWTTPYYKFTCRTVERMKREQNRLYVAMPEPAGRRCLLYARGHDRYLVGEGGYFRQVSVYLPESEQRNQPLTSVILEGTVSRMADQDGRCMFWISDFLRYEGEDWRQRPYDSRLAAIFNRVLKFRKEQMAHKHFTDMFESNDLSVDGRPF